jgi:hypothetical protein
MHLNIFNIFLIHNTYFLKHYLHIFNTLAIFLVHMLHSSPYPLPHPFPIGTDFIINSSNLLFN